MLILISQVPKHHVDWGWLVVSSTGLMGLWVHLNDGGGSPGRGLGVEMRHIGHACQRVQSVHLAHRHGNGGRRQAGRDQRMWHHHEGQLIQNWWGRTEWNRDVLSRDSTVEYSKGGVAFHIQQRSAQQLCLKAITVHAPDMKQVSIHCASLVFIHHNLKAFFCSLVCELNWKHTASLDDRTETGHRCHSAVMSVSPGWLLCF